MRYYLTSVLLLATSIALLWHFGMIVIKGSLIIQEPNQIILWSEVVLVISIALFALWNLILFIGRR